VGARSSTPAGAIPPAFSQNNFLAGPVRSGSMKFYFNATADAADVTAVHRAEGGLRAAGAALAQAIRALQDIGADELVDATFHIANRVVHARQQLRRGDVPGEVR
jgi:hypothetical protein